MIRVRGSRQRFEIERLQRLQFRTHRLACDASYWGNEENLQFKMLLSLASLLGPYLSNDAPAIILMPEHGKIRPTQMHRCVGFVHHEGFIELAAIVG